MPRQPVACRTGCNWSLAVRSILSNGGNRNLCLVATYLQVQSSCGLFRVAQLDFQTLVLIGTFPIHVHCLQVYWCVAILCLPLSSLVTYYWTDHLSLHSPYALLI